MTLSPTTYGTVTGRLLSALGDGPDADLAPDSSAITGTITLTPSVTTILVAGGTGGPFTIMPVPIVCGIDADGYLVYPVGSTNRGARIMATGDPAANPSGWTYTASFAIIAGDRAVVRNPFSFEVPAGVVTDLTTVAPVGASGGVLITRGADGADSVVPGPRGDAGAAAPGHGTFIQPLAPTEPGPWLWIDTSQTELTFWVEEAAAA
ncbi:hypothetical protein RCH12_002768 [Cryobacterium sp. MP_3.1]|uniref:hypothetical protein n=1 Tax=Cryobacterium sp. MP_3.1 TaxID=3071711 RepID=UPI002E064BA6|nr:hypothetical protein [Cryobacterium sp. MP_3.1]